MSGGVLDETLDQKGRVVNVKPSEHSVDVLCRLECSRLLALGTCT